MISQRLKRPQAVILSVQTLVLLVVCCSATAVEICFRSECLPQGNIVRLGDLAEVYGSAGQNDQDLKSIELFPAPAAGERQVLAAREILDRLSLRGVRLSSHQISGASKVTISRETPPSKPRANSPPSENLREQAEARIRTSLVEYLQNYAEATAAWQIEFTLSAEQVRMVCRASARPTVQGGEEPWSGEQQFQIGIGTADSTVQFALAATIASARPVVVARHAISRGTILNRADLELKMPLSAELAEGAFLKIEDAQGREIVRSLGEGEPIGAQDIQAPLLVKKRDIVTVYARSPGIRVRVTGRAVEDGALGDLISVESLADRKTFFARVSGAQEVEVYARADQANAAAASRAEVLSTTR